MGRQYTPNELSTFIIIEQMFSLKSGLSSRTFDYWTYLASCITIQTLSFIITVSIMFNVKC